jgi:hypothetical protein
MQSVPISYSLFLAGILSFSIFFTNAWAQDPVSTPLIRGDVNSDGLIQLDDPVLILLFLYGGDARPACVPVCDVTVLR